MKAFYRGKKVMITGHTGFQGAWLARVLSRCGARVVGVSLWPATTPNLYEIFGLHDAVADYMLDIRTLANMEMCMEKEQPDILFHLAAQAIVRDSYDAPMDTFTTNIIGTANVLEAVRTMGKSVRAVVVVTTDKVYENQETDMRYKEGDKLGGHDPYSSSKAAADIVAQSYIQSFFHPDRGEKSSAALVGIARSGNVIGGGDWANHRLIPDIVRAIYHEKKEVVIRHPASVRPWQHVFEPLHGYMLLAKALYEGDVTKTGAWNFGPETVHRFTVADLVGEALQYFGRGSCRIEPDREKKHEAGLLLLDNTKAKEHLGWRPRFSVPEALRHTTDWYRAYYECPETILWVSDEQADAYFV